MGFSLKLKPQSDLGCSPKRARLISNGIVTTVTIVIGCRSSVYEQFLGVALFF
jgi:hypothetical protein